MSNKIAVVAHNNLKPNLVTFLKEREQWFWGRELVATGRTAELLKENLSLSIHGMKPGNEGGFRDLSQMVTEGAVKCVIFLRDPEIIQDYEDEVTEFVKACNRANLPLATNPASAELLILGLIKKESAELTKSRTQANTH